MKRGHTGWLCHSKMHSILCQEIQMGLTQGGRRWQHDCAAKQSSLPPGACPEGSGDTSAGHLRKRRGSRDPGAPARKCDHVHAEHLASRFGLSRVAGPCSDEPTLHRELLSLYSSLARPWPCACASLEQAIFAFMHFLEHRMSPLLAHLIRISQNTMSVCDRASSEFFITVDPLTVNKKTK